MLALAGALLGTAGSAVVGRLSNPVGKYRLLYAGVLVPFALLAYGLLALLGFGSALVATLPLDVPGPLATVLSDLLELLGAGTVWLAAYAPTVRRLGDVRDVDLPTGRALARMARWIVGTSVVVTVVIAPLRIAPSSASPVAGAVLLAAAGTGFLVAAPWIISLLRGASEPTGDAAERVDALRARAGLDVRDVRVIDTDDEQTASALVRGPPGYRRLFVTTTFLDRFDDGTATALLAIRAARLRARVLAIRVVTAVAGGILLVAAVAGAGPRFPLLGGSAAVVLVGFWRSRRGVRAADADAAERVGAGTVADALDRFAEVHAMEPTRRRVPNPLSPNAALGDRIDRLRERADEDRGA